MTTGRRHKCTMSVVLFFTLCFAATGVNAQTLQIGRFQLVAEPQGTIFLVDTATGRVWRHTLMTEGGNPKPICTPGSLTACFLEVDRMRMTERGYTSEIVGSKR